MEITPALKQRIARQLAAAATALVVSKALEMTWKLITRKDIPSEEDDDQQIVSVAIFVGVTAMVASLARQFAIRRTDTYLAAHPFSEKKGR